MKIIKDNLTHSAVRKLLQQHHDDMAKHSPPESIHALDLSGLLADDVTFWTGWIDGELAGCGALKKLDSRHGELKSMRTSSQFLRQGVAAKLLEHILATAKQQSFDTVSLETGSMPAFLPAQTLYQRFGFKPCPPFSDYVDDPYSLFFSKSML